MTSMLRCNFGTFAKVDFFLLATLGKAKAKQTRKAPAQTNMIGSRTLKWAVAASILSCAIGASVVQNNPAEWLAPFANYFAVQATQAANAGAQAVQV
jgi:hypothetical protein